MIAAAAMGTPNGTRPVLARDFDIAAKPTLRQDGGELHHEIRDKGKHQQHADEGQAGGITQQDGRGGQQSHVPCPDFAQQPED